jgi:ribosomal protein S5
MGDTARRRTHRRGLVGRRGLDQRGLVGVGAGHARQATKAPATPATTAGKRN